MTSWRRLALLLLSGMLASLQLGAAAVGIAAPAVASRGQLLIYSYDGPTSSAFARPHAVADRDEATVLLAFAEPSLTTVREVVATEAGTANALPELGAQPNFENPAASPGEGWEWRGTGEPGSEKGSWYNPNTGESLHPDLSHPDPIGPHYDWKAQDGTTYRVYPDGRVVPK